ncbi:hypothetical protein R8556_22120 [Klebsiella pneumoniae]|uniref:hypothetical protein n=1 Tax=Klebsiella pneumoniae complex TaxID=3390273 RepID=UPI001111F7C7|nr:hypothetical protein [Klebsiella pneumoniae]MCD9353341.1 hypothetical protein [Klebsiella pneumoniae]MCL0161206.1 hypothetical protein [Klebsiella pneumoniae]QDJ83840.1 hypothetical protein CI661_0018980 [Klebsiella pneumoniae subsp. pneumoniae]QER47613.1 hypothetical protein F2X40_08480 [Klebsiella pneumoniae]QYG20022.1 hypothetical protein K0P51_18865 [Klebsiella pneumoniae]
MSPSTTVAERVRGNRYQALYLPLCRAAAMPCPRKRSAAGQGQRAQNRFYAGRRRRLARPT